MNTTQHPTVCVVLCVVFEGVQERRALIGGE